MMDKIIMSTLQTASKYKPLEAHICVQIFVHTLEFRLIQ